MASTHSSGIDERLEHWLTANGVRHEVHEHPLAYTALATARAEGVEPRSFAKVVGVRTEDGGVALIVLDAVDVLDLGKVHDAVGERVRLLSEAELAAACPDWEVGTVPPIPELCGAPVYADEAVRDAPMISFNAGSHRVAVRVDRAAWENAAQIVYADVTRRHGSPA